MVDLYYFEDAVAEEIERCGMRGVLAQTVIGFPAPDFATVDEALALNPILVTALNPVIGYEKGAATAKQAYKQKRPIMDVALETTGLSKAELKKLLDPVALTKGGIHGGK